MFLFAGLSHLAQLIFAVSLCLAACCEAAALNPPATNISFSAAGYYSTTVVRAVFTGPWVSANNPTVTLHFTRIGNMAFVTGTEFSAITAGGAAAVIAAVGVVPADYRSLLVGSVQHAIIGINNNAAGVATLDIRANGDIYITRLGGHFDAFGTAGWRSFSVSWAVS